jgi:hypothetical protein
MDVGGFSSTKKSPVQFFDPPSPLGKGGNTSSFAPLDDAIFVHKGGWGDSVPYLDDQDIIRRGSIHPLLPPFIRGVRGDSALRMYFS